MRAAPFLVWVAAFLVPAQLLLAAERPASGTPVTRPSILLISIDTLRPVTIETGGR